jgi:hypothetical protein
VRRFATVLINVPLISGGLMATQNDVTGDAIKSRNSNQNYLDNWDAIFGKKDKAEEEPEVEPKDEGDK